VPKHCDQGIGLNSSVNNRIVAVFVLLYNCIVYIHHDQGEQEGLAGLHGGKRAREQRFEVGL